MKYHTPTDDSFRRDRDGLTMANPKPPSKRPTQGRDKLPPGHDPNSVEDEPRAPDEPGAENEMRLPGRRKGS